MQPIVTEKWVDTPIDSWMEIKVEHPEINQRVIEEILEDFPKLDWEEKIYVADNKLIRFEHKVLTKGKPGSIDRYFTDICLHIKEGYFTIMRNYKPGYEFPENEIVGLICNELEKM